MDQDIKERMGSEIVELLQNRERLYSQESAVMTTNKDDSDIGKEIKKHFIQEGKSKHDFNWAWVYYVEEQDRWQQFDCTDCLQLEFHYQAFRKTGES